ncbi:MAG: glycosyltransferase family 4 protein [Thermoflavifilum sp.]|nr:glycosyltransferase family 4 protein [Thermoflavifilum sp.]
MQVYGHDLFRVCRLVDGPLVPAYGGASRYFSKISTTMADLGAHVVIFHVYRGWSDLDLIRRQNYRTYIFEPQTFYSDTDLLVQLLQRERIDIVQFFDYQHILLFAPTIRAHLPWVRLCYEAHDVIPDFLRSLNRSELEIQTATKNLSQAISLVDFIITLTETDRKSLVSYGVDPRRIAAIPAGCDPDEIRFVGLSALHEKNLLFLGNLFHEPNRIALTSLVEGILPAVLRTIPEVRLIVVGDAPDNLVNELCTHPSILYLGVIDDLNEVFSKTSIAVNPVTKGSGIRMKVLDYVSAGIPVISTRFGLEDLPLEDCVIFEDDLDLFPKHIINILSEPGKLSDKFVLKCRGVAEELSWRRITERMCDAYSRLSRMETVSPKGLRTGFNVDGDRPYYMNDFLTLGRYTDRAPVFTGYKYGILGHGKLAIIPYPNEAEMNETH